MMTTSELRLTILDIISQRHMTAQRSEYDWKVSTKAVAVAASAVKGVNVAGSAAEYRQAVLSTLEALQSDYNDPDGEHTNGSSEIGSLIREIRSILWETHS